MERYGISGFEGPPQDAALEAALLAALQTGQFVISPDELAGQSTTAVLRKKMGLRFLPESCDLSS
jgi:hypothetical protein